MLNSESQIELERQLRRQDPDSRPRHHCENGDRHLSSKTVSLSREENWWQNKELCGRFPPVSIIISHARGRKKEDRRETKYSEFHFLFS